MNKLYYTIEEVNNFFEEQSDEELDAQQQAEALVLLTEINTKIFNKRVQKTVDKFFRNFMMDLGLEDGREWELNSQVKKRIYKALGRFYVFLYANIVLILYSILEEKQEEYENQKKEQTNEEYISEGILGLVGSLIKWSGGSVLNFADKWLIQIRDAKVLYKKILSKEKEIYRLLGKIEKMPAMKKNKITREDFLRFLSNYDDGKTISEMANNVNAELIKIDYESETGKLSKRLKKMLHGVAEELEITNLESGSATKLGGKIGRGIAKGAQKTKSISNKSDRLDV